MAEPSIASFESERRDVTTTNLSRIIRGSTMRPSATSPHDDPVTIPVVAVRDVTVERVDTDVLLGQAHAVGVAELPSPTSSVEQSVFAKSLLALTPTPPRPAHDRLLESVRF